MKKPDCPYCHSDANVIIMSIGFRCAFCNKRFFKSDVINEEHEVQTKFN